MLTQLKKKITSNYLLQVLFALLIFTTPSNLFKTFFETTAYVRGLQIDYLIPKVYLSDLVLLGILFISLFSKQITFKMKSVSLLLLTILLAFQCTMDHSLVAILFLLRIFALIIVSTVIIRNKFLKNSKLITTVISITLLFQSLLAWYQYLNQKSFFGYLFLGETDLNAYSGIAQSTLFGVQKILPYGTTAHPNILAGIILVFVLFLLNNKPTDSIAKKIHFFIISLAISVVIVTQSFSAIMGLLIGLGVILFTKKMQFSFTPQKITHMFLITNILVIFAVSQFSKNETSFNQTNTSITRRSYLNSAASQMILKNPIQGVGIQQFTAQLEKYSENQEVVRFIQPVHNILLLIVAETGLLGILLIAILLLPIIKKNHKVKHPEYIFALFPIATLDHYLLTIQSGLLLLFLVILFTNYSDTKDLASE